MVTNGPQLEQNGDTIAKTKKPIEKQRSNYTFETCVGCDFIINYSLVDLVINIRMRQFCILFFFHFFSPDKKRRTSE